MNAKSGILHVIGSRRWKLLTSITSGLLLIGGLFPCVWGQGGTNPLNLYQNYFVAGDYVVAGWVEAAPDGTGFAPGTISVPDTLQPLQPGVPASVPKGANIVAAYLYWATVEGNQSTFAGTQAYFDGYKITGTVLGNPNAPTSWSSGGCAGSSQGSKTMRTYRADVHPYLPVDTNPSSPTFGATIANGTFQVRLADSGSNGNTTPLALGATLVIIYRVLSPAVPLNAIVLYDGAYAPSNAGQIISQNLVGFYEPALGPIAKITHIVANGQLNKGEQVYLNTTAQPLPSLYGSTTPPFPGIYNTNGSHWDNPTWVLSNYGYVNTSDTSETTSVVPTATNSGCVSWGVIIFSTTVQDTDGDGLLDVWESNQGYSDVVRGLDTNTPVGGQWVPLPGADPNRKDIFAELDYFSNLDGKAGPYLHSHLPKEAAIDAVGNAFAAHNIAIHFDLGPGIYQGNPYVISYPLSLPNPLPPGTSAPQAGAGGNAISEGQILCTDGNALCAFPGQPTVGWKGGFEAIKNSSTLGNFQPGREKSYHYVLFGHSLASPRSYWSTVAYALADPTIPQLVSILNTGNSAIVTLQSPQGVIKPGDCPNPQISGCGDINNDRVSITGALGQTALNGSYRFSNFSSITANNLTTTTFTINTNGVASGNYNYGNEPQLAVTYLGPTARSGQSEFGGGGDSAITLGLWGADNASNCQADPSQPLTAGQVYCDDQVGTLNVQIGTLLHELGHTLALTHGGTYYRNLNYPSLPTYEPNCKANYLSVMNYLFQVRGFVDGPFDYSGQTLAPLNEAYPLLNEAVGVGSDTVTGQTAAHLTRWYSTPNTLDKMLQATSGGRYALSHCDGSPLGPNDVPGVRVDGTVAAGGTFSGPLDWNNDLIAPDAVNAPGVDLNYNGSKNDPPFTGYNDWQAMNLQQVDARENAFGLSGGGVQFGGGGVQFGGGGVQFGGGGVDDDGGGVQFGGGGVQFGGGGVQFGGGGIDQSEDQANSTADVPTGLTCSVALSGIPACTGSGTYLENAKKVPLTWTAPIFGQTRAYTIWRAVGSYSTVARVVLNAGAFSVLKTLTGTPPSPAYLDSAIKNGTTYTYFVTDSNKFGVQSAASAPVVVTVKF